MLMEWELLVIELVQLWMLLDEWVSEVLEWQ